MRQTHPLQIPLCRRILLQRRVQQRALVRSYRKTNDNLLPQKTQMTNTDKLLQQALDPFQTSQSLLEIWKATKSPRVRKAVAANPNCTTDLLKVSARLYVREVLSNPSLEIVMTFLDDPFVDALWAVWEDPDRCVKGCISGKVKSIKRSELQILYNTALVSPKLKHIDSLLKILYYLPKGDVRREFKDKGLFERLRGIVTRGSISGIGMGDVSILNTLGLIDKKGALNEIVKGAKSRSYDRTLTRSANKTFVLENLEAAAGGCNVSYNLLAFRFISMSHFNTKDICNLISKGEIPVSEGGKNILVNILTDIYKFSSISHLSCPSIPVLVKTLTSLALRDNKGSVYHTLCYLNSIGLIRPEYSQDVCAGFKGLVSRGEDLWDDLLNLPEELFIYVMRYNLIDSNWFVRTDQTSKYGKVIDRLNSVNEVEWRGGLALFTSVDLGAYPLARLYHNMPPTGSVKMPLPNSKLIDVGIANDVLKYQTGGSVYKAHCARGELFV